jgi:hypothetical protein
MFHTDQPGRVLALVVVAPAMLAAAQLLEHPRCARFECRHAVARVLGGFAVVFWFYELFWICNYPPKRLCA